MQQAWQAQHGKMPEALQELLQGVYVCVCAVCMCCVCMCAVYVLCVCVLFVYARAHAHTIMRAGA